MTIKKVAGFTYQKADSWDGKDLLVPLTAYIKIDGIRTIGHDDDKGYVSRAGKPLDGLNLNATIEVDNKLLLFEDCEVYKKDWNTSYSMCSNTKSKEPITEDMIYPLKDGEVDSRLIIGEFPEGMTAEELIDLRDDIVAQGYEGLIIRCTPPRARAPKWIRIKPHITGDVFIRGFEEALEKDTGCGLGRVGKVITDHGNVGIFKDMTLDQLEALWRDYQIHPTHYENMLIQVEFMEWTVNGKMRHAKWDKGIMRLDKSEESFDKEKPNHV